jgi:hypothetical protein
MHDANALPIGEVGRNKSAELSSSRPELIEPISAPAVWDSRTASLLWIGTGLTKSEVNTNNKLLTKNSVFSRGNELNNKKDFSLRTGARGAGAVALSWRGEESLQLQKREEHGADLKEQAEFMSGPNTQLPTRISPKRIYYSPLYYLLDLLISPHKQFGALTMIKSLEATAKRDKKLFVRFPSGISCLLCSCAALLVSLSSSHSPPPLSLSISTGRNRPLSCYFLGVVHWSTIFSYLVVLIVWFDHHSVLPL